MNTNQEHIRLKVGRVPVRKEVASSWYEYKFDAEILGQHDVSIMQGDGCNQH